MSNPTDFEQLMLEYINQARMDPQGEYDRFITSTNPVQAIEPQITFALNYFNVDLSLYQQQLQGLVATAPLAWNANLGDAARAHSQLMINHDAQSHKLPGEAGLGARISDAGYTGWNRLAENIYAYTESPAYGHAGFFIDWGFGPGGIQNPAGHRVNIMNDNLTEVGIGVLAETNGSTSVGPYVVTQDFGHRFAYDAQFVGVSYDDTDANGFYSMGEGNGGISVTVNPSAGGGSSTTTQGAGGYAVEGAVGWNTVTFSGGGLPGNVSVDVLFGSDNVKLDLVDGDTILSSADAILAAGARALGLLGQFSIDGTGNVLNNVITGNSGVNQLSGLAGHDTISGGDGGDTLRGASGNDSMAGDGGNDRLFGNQDEDVLLGGSGNDWLHGGRDSDSLDGGAGVDTLYGGKQDDHLTGGAGGDTLIGNHNNDSINGGDGNDWMHGGQHSDTLQGDGGADIVNGGKGDDVLLGGSGADLLIGGPGRDFLTGGSGNDNFDFNSIQESLPGSTTRDQIVGGFDNPGAVAGDQIDVSDIAIFVYLGSGGFSGTGSAQLRLADEAGQTIVQGDVNGNGLADFEIAIDNMFASSMSAADFIGIF